jgi:hypothetical protein
MKRFASAFGTRIVPALLTAAGVVLITAGLLSYASPSQAGILPEQPDEIITMDPAEESATPDLALASPSAEPAATSTVNPTASASASPGASPAASPGASPAASPAASASLEPAASPTPTPKLGNGHATRVVIPALKIDLPVIPGNNGYPLCNVAMYMDDLGKPLKDLGRPGRDGATYIYSHARDGMFGPIYRLAIEKGTPRKMLGMVVQVYSDDAKVYLYEIREVRLHQTSLDDAISATRQELWLQTSEGPRGTPGKTQVRALPISVDDADYKESHPKPKPVACG